MIFITPIKIFNFFNSNNKLPTYNSYNIDQMLKLLSKLQLNQNDQIIYRNLQKIGSETLYNKYSGAFRTDQFNEGEGGA